MADVINLRGPVSTNQSLRFAVALCRVSTEDQFQKGLSIPEQRSRIEKWAEANSVKVLRWEEIHHSAYRGLDEDPRVMDLLKLAKESSQITLFLVDEKSRFARRKYLRVTWQEELRRAGVSVIGVSEPEYNSNSIHGIWIEGISETKDEARSIETAYHTTKGMMRNAETRDMVTGFCYKNGGVAPDGYDNQRVIRGKDSRGKDIVKLLWAVNEERAALVRYIILTLWAKKRMSYKEIRDHLNGHGLKYDGLTGPILNPKGCPWSNTTIREICMRGLEGVYSGYYYWNRTGRDLRGTGQKWKSQTDWVIIENAHPAIISNEEWDHVKKIMEPLVLQNKKHQRTNVRSDNSRYLFSGENVIGEPMFICSACGGAINSNQVSSVFYYLCSTYNNRGKAGCNKGAYIRREDLEAKVLSAISKRFSPEMVKNLVQECNATLDEVSSDQESAERHTLKSIATLDKSISNLVAAIEQGSTTVTALMNRLETLQAERQALEIERAEIKNDRPHYPRITEEMIMGKVRSLQSVIQDPMASNKERRMMVRYFIRQLRFLPETGEVEVFFWPNPAEDKDRLSLIKGKKIKDSSSFMVSDGAGNRGRTGTSRSSRDFKSLASACSAIPAG